MYSMKKLLIALVLTLSFSAFSFAEDLPYDFFGIDEPPMQGQDVDKYNDKEVPIQGQVKQDATPSEIPLKHKQKSPKSKAKKQSKQEKIEEYEVRNTQPKADYNYEDIFKNLKTAQVKFIDQVDPDEYYDAQKLYFSPYPLFRVTDAMYVAGQVVQPGYYLLTPREYDKQKVVLFKEGGKVKNVVPIFEHELINKKLTYQKPPKKWYQIRDRYEFQTQYYETKILAYDLYGDFFEVDLYYREGLHKMIFKKNPY